MSKRQLTAISLFSGGLGLDLGLEQAGFTIGAAVEWNRFACQTIRQNRPNLPLFPRKIEQVTTDELLKAASLEPEEPTVVTGGPCCQSFSTAGQRGSVSDPRGVMFREFVRVVREARPRFFIMENVKGVLSAAIRHRPLKDRGPGHPPLEPDEELGSAFRLILKELRATGYYVVFDLLNAADYGVPQTRERVIFIGSRDGEPVAMPEPTHAREPSGRLLPWVTLREALRGLEDPDPAYNELSPSKKRFLKLVPDGGNWRNLPARLHAKALGGAYASWGGRGGFFRRLAWDRPTPALTTRPDSKATMLCHPTELRPLSVREYTRLQQFPDGWVFAGGVPQQYIQAGNAVPIGLGRAIGEAIRRTMRRRKRENLLGKVVCENAGLVERMANRPRTVLNPSRMRIDGSIEAAREWLAAEEKYRHWLLDFIDTDGDEQEIERNGRPRKR
jgi:DNA (cytosine-5)-methyltransferase 1